METHREDEPSGAYLRDPGFDYGAEFSVRAMLRSAFHAWRSLVWRLVALSFLAAAVDFSAGLFMAGSGGEVGSFGAAQLGGLLSLPFGIAAWAGTFILLDERARGISRRSAGSALWQGIRFFATYFAISFLMGIAMIPAMIPGAIFYRIEMRAIGIPLLVAGGIVDIYLLVRWSLSQVVAVAEGVGATNSMARSGALLKGRLPRAIAFLAIVAGINGAGFGLVWGAFDLAAGALGFSEAAAGMALTAVDTLLLSPLAYCMIFALYAALRTRNVDTSSRLRAEFNTPRKNPRR